INGLHNVVWDVMEAADHTVTFEYFSKDGEENYPGNLRIRLTYTLNDDDEMEVLIHAVTDADTHVNIVHHAFFNLNGFGNGDISKIRLDVFTLEPGLQLYSGNVMKGENLLISGFADERYHAFCLETQHFPDSPNQPSFPSTLLSPGDDYQTRTVFKFSVDNK